MIATPCEELSILPSMQPTGQFMNTGALVAPKYTSRTTGSEDYHLNRFLAANDEETRVARRDMMELLKELPPPPAVSLA
jgi:hypothetical protein